MYLYKTDLESTNLWILWESIFYLWARTGAEPEEMVFEFSTKISNLKFKLGMLLQPKNERLQICFNFLIHVSRRGLKSSESVPSAKDFFSGLSIILMFQIRDAGPLVLLSFTSSNIGFSLYFIFELQIFFTLRSRYFILSIPQKYNIDFDGITTRFKLCKNSLTQFHQCVKTTMLLSKYKLLTQSFCVPTSDFFTTTFFTIMRTKNCPNYKSFNPGNYPTFSYRLAFVFLSLQNWSYLFLSPILQTSLFSFCSYLLIRLSSAGVWIQVGF